MPVGPEGSTPNYMEEALLKHIVGAAEYKPHANLRLALGTAPPQETDRSLSGLSEAGQLPHRGKPPLP